MFSYAEMKSLIADIDSQIALSQALLQRAGAQRRGPADALALPPLPPPPSPPPPAPKPAESAPGSLEFKADPKGPSDVETIPLSGGWELSLDLGDKTHKIGTDDKGESVETGTEKAILQKYTEKLSFGPKTYMAGGRWPVTISGGVEIKLGISTSAGETVGSKGYVSVGAKVVFSPAGVGEKDLFDVGIGGGLETSLQLGPQIKSDGEGLTIAPLVIEVKATGFMSARAKLLTGGSWGPELKKSVAQWKIFELTVGWKENGGGSASLQEGNMQALADLAGKLIEQAIKTVPVVVEKVVEDHAPEVAKEAAVDAAKWAIESDGGHTITEGVDAVLDAADKVTDGGGTRLGDDVESVAKWAVGGDWETSAEANERFTKQAEAENAASHDFGTTAKNLNLWSDQELGKWRSAAEWNQVVEIKNKGGDWKKAMIQLAATARQRQAEARRLEAQKKAEEEKKKAEDERRKAEEERRRLLNLAKQRQHDAQMAMGKCNGLNKRQIEIKPAATKKYSDAFAAYTAGGKDLAAERSAEAIGCFEKAIALFKEGDALQG